MAFAGVVSSGRLALKLRLCHLSEQGCSFRCSVCSSSLFPRMCFLWPRSRISTEQKLAPLDLSVTQSEVSAVAKERLVKVLSRRRLARLRMIVAAGGTGTSVNGTEPGVSFSPCPSPLDALRLKVFESEQLRTAREAEDAFSSSPSLYSRASKTSSSLASFKALGLSEELIAAISEMKLGDPTEIQACGIPAILAGDDVLLASHTGSGKTLAYLLPLVQKLREDEERTQKMARPRRPRAVVLGPTRELTEQVLQVAKALSHHARFRSAMISGGCRPKPQEEVLNSSLDLVVGTPGRLLMHVENGHLSYGDVKYVVLDEADTMFDRGFGPEVRKFLGPLRKRSAAMPAGGEGSSFQCILVSATLTKAVQRLLDEEFPGVKHVHTSSLHKRVVGSRHDFLSVSGDENKLEVLSQVLEPAVAKGQRLMVFCNTLASCRATEHFLRESGIDTVCYHGEVSAEERVENLERFRGTSGREEDSNVTMSLSRHRSPRVPVLVCTDLAARGLDLVVDHVVMFDFPRNPVDYLHRTGRTARMGAKGRITSLVTKRDQLLASEIEAAIKTGSSMEHLSSDKTKLLAMKKREAEEQRKLKGKVEKKGEWQQPGRQPLKAFVATASGKPEGGRAGSGRLGSGRVGSKINKPSLVIPKGTKGAARLALQRGEVPIKFRVKDTTRRRRS